MSAPTSLSCAYVQIVPTGVQEAVCARRRAALGAADEDLDPLPAGLVARPWADVRGSHLGAEECAVCMEPLGHVAEPIVQLRCRHSYCDTCVRQLVQFARGGLGRCPQCRGPIA
jgi:hypothetical protein